MSVVQTLIKQLSLAFGLEKLPSDMFEHFIFMNLPYPAINNQPYSQVTTTSLFVTCLGMDNRMSQHFVFVRVCAHARYRLQDD